MLLRAADAAIRRRSCTGSIGSTALHRERRNLRSPRPSALGGGGHRARGPIVLRGGLRCARQEYLNDAPPPSRPSSTHARPPHLREPGDEREADADTGRVRNTRCSGGTALRRWCVGAPSGTPGPASSIIRSAPPFSPTVTHRCSWRRSGSRSSRGSPHPFDLRAVHFREHALSICVRIGWTSSVHSLRTCSVRSPMSVTCMFASRRLQPTCGRGRGGSSRDGWRRRAFHAMPRVSSFASSSGKLWLLPLEHRRASEDRRERGPMSRHGLEERLLHLTECGQALAASSARC